MGQSVNVGDKSERKRNMDRAEAENTPHLAQSVKLPPKRAFAWGNLAL